jgi:hypothetical protein
MYLVFLLEDSDSIFGNSGELLTQANWPIGKIKAENVQ